MSTPTTYMALPNPTPGGDPGAWATDLQTCVNGLDALAVSNIVPVSATGSLAVYNGTALVKADATGGAVVLTLPDATIAANKGRVYEVVKIDVSGNTVTLTGFGGQTFSGSATLVISTRWDGFTVESDGANWIITGVIISTSGATTGSGAFVLQTGPTISGPTISGTITISGNVTYNAANPTFFSSTGSGAVVLAAGPTITGHPTIEGVTSTGATGSGNFVFDTGPGISNATLTGTVTVSGTASFTTANPTFFSAQGTGGKVQLSTGTTTTGDVVTYDASGNTVDSGTLLTSLAPLASPTFTGTVTVSSTLLVSASGLVDLSAASVHTTVNKDIAGIVAMTGSATASVVFNSPYTGVNAPVVIITPQFDPTGVFPAAFWVTIDGVTTNWTGFTVHNDQSQTGNVGYIVMGQA